MRHPSLEISANVPYFGTFNYSLMEHVSAEGITKFFNLCNRFIRRLYIRLLKEASNAKIIR